MILNFVHPVIFIENSFTENTGVRGIVHLMASDTVNAAVVFKDNDFTRNTGVRESNGIWLRHVLDS